MVSYEHILFLGISGSICFALPIILYLIFKSYYNIKFFPAVLGAAVFVVFALGLEQLFHALVLGSESGAAFMQNSPYAFAAYAGLAAGVFEETGRFAAFKALKKKYMQPENAISYGIGHAGIEAWLIASLQHILFFFAAMAYNSGSRTEAAISAAQALAATPPIVILLSAVERISAIALHIGLSILVWPAASLTGYMHYYFFAVFLHAAADFIAALFQAGSITSVALIEALLFAISAATLFFALKLLKKLIWDMSAQQDSEALI
ncbi:MAG: YhfC family intramembrane metalloprotease [Eubacteriaceae bacterium]|nr:YhfC family intramembrane metalloprotease [Eubacteriaceae bacterium]